MTESAETVERTKIRGMNKPLIGLVVMGIVVIGAWGGWQILDRTRESASFGAMPAAAEQDSLAQREESRERYVAHLAKWPHGRQAAAVRERQQQSERVWEDADFKQLQELSPEVPAQGIAQLAKTYENFLQNWPNGHKHTQVSQWLKEADDRMGGPVFNTRSMITSDHSPRQREDFLARSQAFIKDYPHRSRVTGVTEWLEVATQRHAELLGDEEFQRLTEERIRRSDRAQNRKEAYRLLESFLGAHPQQGWTERQKTDGDELLERRQALVTEVNQEWAALTQQLRKSDDPPDVRMERLEAFRAANPPIGAFETEFEQMKELLDEALDRSEYETLRRQLQELTRAARVTENEHAELRDAMERYEKRAYPAPTMRDAVRGWIAWYDRMKNVTKARVQIERIELPLTSPLTRVRGRVLLRIEMQGNNVECDLGQKQPDGPTRKDCDKEIVITVSMNQPVQVDVKSKWGPIWGVMDPTAEATVTVFSRAVSLSGNGGILFILIDGQPDLPLYQGKGVR